MTVKYIYTFINLRFPIPRSHFLQFQVLQVRVLQALVLEFFLLQVPFFQVVSLVQSRPRLQHTIINKSFSKL